MQQEDSYLTFCKIHKQKIIDYVRIDSHEEDLFFCSKCLITKRTQNSRFINVSSVLSSNANELIHNWPPINDDDLVNQMIAEAKNHATIEQISEFFNCFEKEAVQGIQKIKKKIMLEYENMNVGLFHQSTLEKYNEIGQVSKLKDLFKISDQNELQDKLKSLLLGFSENKEKNTQNLKQVLVELKNKNKLFNLSILQSQKEVIINLLSQMTISTEDMSAEINQEQRVRLDNELNIKMLTSIPKQILERHESLIENGKQNIQNYQNKINNISNLIDEYKFSYKVEDNQLSNINSFKNNISKLDDFSSCFNQNENLSLEKNTFISDCYSIILSACNTDFVNIQKIKSYASNLKQQIF